MPHSAPEAPTYRFPTHRLNGTLVHTLTNGVPNPWVEDGITSWTRAIRADNGTAVIAPREYFIPARMELLRVRLFGDNVILTRQAWDDLLDELRPDSPTAERLRAVLTIAPRDYSAEQEAGR